ncbi:MAG: hypothetical protein HKL86_05615 [Acidimicrobiaceae bacterium]|nr:hypothetical protein [Acidimicrobiaceae bacterium]
MVAITTVTGTAQAQSVPHQPKLNSGCRWIAQSLKSHINPSVLAQEVLRQMTLHEKANMLVLVMRPQLENLSDGVPRLCIPELWLSDGPVGLGDGLAGVTQFPSAIGVAASFDPHVASSIGVALAQEARSKGINVVQGTELNLARVAQSGRIFETYGEDPFLTSVMGVANIEGTQSQGVMAMAKHLGAYTQETARLNLNQIVSVRALEELYLAPFRAAVQQAHVASVMCSYGSINGVNSCSDPFLYSSLRSWGFRGFVRSDFHAIPPTAVAKAFRAGLSLIKPATTLDIMYLIETGAISRAVLNRAVLPVLTEMFRFREVGTSRSGNLANRATTASHVATALHAAESSIVLLKNAGAILPLATTKSIAVIGTDANQTPMVAGGGSSAVLAPRPVTPLSAIRSVMGSHASVTFASGGPAGVELDSLSGIAVVRGTPLKLIRPPQTPRTNGKGDIIIDNNPNITPAVATATSWGKGEGWSSWRMAVRAKATGTYEVAVQQCGDAWFYLNHRPLLSSAGIHSCSQMSTTVHLVAGRSYLFDGHWFSVTGVARPRFGILDVTPDINRAVSVARKAQVAVVFAGDYNSESLDRPNLYLPGDANALIKAVAAVNPHTVVVLNTGGAVLMPWVKQVAGVLEAWYPGQVDGTAVAKVLAGAIDPSGHLPITFPASASATPTESANSFPGVKSVVRFNGGLDVGYRWYQAHHVTPLFAFGYGLSYTSFSLANPGVTKSRAGYIVSTDVKNTGSTSGAAVVQCYVAYPSAATEPPLQLRGFARVALASGQSKQVSILIPWSGFASYIGHSFVTVHGHYGISIGQSSTSLPLHLSVTF